MDTFFTLTFARARRQHLLQQCANNIGNKQHRRTTRIALGPNGQMHARELPANIRGQHLGQAHISQTSAAPHRQLCGKGAAWALGAERAQQQQRQAKTNERPRCTGGLSVWRSRGAPVVWPAGGHAFCLGRQLGLAAFINIPAEAKLK